MSVDLVRQRIAAFRTWLETHGEPALRSQQDARVAEWREELGATERLLDLKPELPIAFLGPAQQGKSSLINALLGETVLAVGGAVGACTSVITSVHYRPGRHYRAEIDFISRDDWKAELEAIRSALAATTSAEDTELDREELLAARKTAEEKLEAVYRRHTAETIDEALSDSKLGLPEEIARAMAKAAPIVIERENAISFRNEVRRYLVGRDQHDDARFWPLITRVRLYGSFDVLKDGVVLVDLPGLNDPNPAREQVTKKYLEDARYIWLVCNSQTGIESVFTRLLRDNGFFFRLFLGGRLGTFAVITTRIDDSNFESILAERGIAPEDFDGDHVALLEYRRGKIAEHVRQSLVSIAEEIVARAGATGQREAFLERVRAVPVFSVSSAAYLHGIGRMPLYQGLRLAQEDTHVPRLIEHLHSVTREESAAAQAMSARVRLQVLHQQVRRFFLDSIRRVEQDGEDARREWEAFAKVAEQTIGEGETGLEQVRICAEESLDQHRIAFDERTADLDARAAAALEAVFRSWEDLHWRSLQAAARRKGAWFSRAAGRDLDLNRDIARAYLDLLPFIWEDFFGKRLADLVNQVVTDTESELHTAAARLRGALDMLRHQPEEGMGESMEANLRAAADSFQLQAGQVRAALSAQVLRTRQGLAGGLLASASSVMRPAYAEVDADLGGTGIKRRMLDVLVRHAQAHAPAIFVTMRQDLAEGVAVLLGAMKPQLGGILGHGEKLLRRFRDNLGQPRDFTPELRESLRAALDRLPGIDVSSEVPEPLAVE